MKKITVVGHFGNGMEFLDGQTIKTKMIYEELKKAIGNKDVQRIDTYNWHKNKLVLIYKCIKSLTDSENIIILPAYNGLKVFAPLFILLNKVFNRKLHYSVIGGWLPEYLDKNSWLIKYLKRIDKIYVETNSMKVGLEERGFANVEHIPNFKKLRIISSDEVDEYTMTGYKVCIFSRILREKGIEDAINAVRYANEKLGKDLYNLDIYGQIDSAYESEFNELKLEFPEYINYKGVVDPRQSVDTLKSYYALLFPTYYKGEGFAGTIIDAYSAGIPVIASDWKYNSEIVKDGYNGFIFQSRNYKALGDILIKIYYDSNLILNMKKNCIKEAELYKPEKIIKQYLKYF